MDELLQIATKENFCEATFVNTKVLFPSILPINCNYYFEW